jgi:pyruvate/2-oxoglutarate dehydrogenase complex dihydrolipoamide acyltransferase (E2) component
LNVVNTYLVAAAGLVATNDNVQAEVRYQQALRQAEQSFGLQDDCTIFVISILAAFYRLQDRPADAEALESRIASWDHATAQAEAGEDAASQKFVKMKPVKKEAQAPSARRSTKMLSPEVRRAFQLLGLSADEPLTHESINKAWKKQIVGGAVHPDLGGDVDESILLNNAKSLLVSHLESQGSKLASHFQKSAGAL